MALGIFLIVGLVVCALLNLLVIAVLVKSRQTNFMGVLMISLAVSDLLQAGFGYSVEIHSYYASKQISDASCQFSAFIVTFLGLVSISHLAGMAVERHVFLCYPIKMRAWLESPIISLYVIIPSWIYGFIWALFPLIGWSRYNRQPGMPHTCSIDVTSKGWLYASYTYCLLFWCFFIPLAVITYCSYSIYRSLKIHRRRSTLIGVDTEFEREDAKYRAERQHSYMSLLMIGSFLLAWSPYACCVLVLTIQGALPRYLLTVAALFAKSSTLYNPIIYLIILKEFRTRCRMLLTSTWTSLFHWLSDMCKDSQIDKIIRVKRSTTVISGSLVSGSPETFTTSLTPIVNTAVFFTRHNSFSSNV